MTEDIIKAVCAAIYNEFGGGYTIYTEAVAQDTAVPCFFVICTHPKLNRYMGNEYYSETPVTVQYLPQNVENYRAECEGVFERLSLTLDTIAFEESYVHGTELNGEIVDGVLNFFVNYNFFVLKQELMPPRMEKMETTQILE